MIQGIQGPAPTTGGPEFELNERVWLWVKSDGKARCFRVQRRRNTAAAKLFLGGSAGLPTTDELASYSGYDGRKRSCATAIYTAGSAS